MFFISSFALANAPKKVAVVPFKVNASQDLSYVRDGIQDMLTTRLFAPGKVETVDPALVKKALAEVGEPLTREKARALGEKLGVDYVLFGSVSVFGKMVSVDAELLPIKEKKPPITLYTQVKGLGEVIPALSRFARRCRAYVLGEEVPAQSVAVKPPLEAAPRVASAPKPLPPARSSTPEVSPARMHPEKLVESASVPASAPSAEPSSVVSPPPKRSGVPPVHYVDEDQWPDYPPSEETLPPVKREARAVQPVPPVAAPVPPPSSAPASPQKPKKKSLLRRIGSKLWPFGKKEKEVKLSEVPPPPPPPPPPPGTPAPQSPQGYRAPQPPYASSRPPVASAPQPPVTPPQGGGSSGGETWEWY